MCERVFVSNYAFFEGSRSSYEAPRQRWAQFLELRETRENFLSIVLRRFEIHGLQLRTVQSE